MNSCVHKEGKTWVNVVGIFEMQLDTPTHIHMQLDLTQDRRTHAYTEKRKPTDVDKSTFKSEVIMQ